jgi:hypothetical protein
VQRRQQQVAPATRVGAAFVGEGAQQHVDGVALGVVCFGGVKMKIHYFVILTPRP